jgi:ribosome-associated toxin RatA of RatAB toxin-antitoxin module
MFSASAAIAVVAVAVASSSPAPWGVIHREDNLVVMTRDRPGLPIQEMKAEAIVDVDADILWAIVSDVEGHTRLIPDTTVSRILRVEGDTLIVLQRSEPQWLSPREYVIAVDLIDRVKDGTGTTRTMRWKTRAAETKRIASADAVAVAQNTGSWKVEPLRDGRSKVTFTLAFDPAGFVPPFVVNAAQRFGAQQALAVLVQAASTTQHDRRAGRT